MRAFQSIRHEQLHPLPLPAGTTAATVCSQERLMAMSLIEKSASGLQYVSRVRRQWRWRRRRPVIDWPLGHFGSAGSGLVENQNKGSLGV